MALSPPHGPAMWVKSSSSTEGTAWGWADACRSGARRARRSLHHLTQRGREPGDVSRGQPQPSAGPRTHRASRRTPPSQDSASVKIAASTVIAAVHDCISLVHATCGTGLANDSIDAHWWIATAAQAHDRRDVSPAGRADVGSASGAGRGKSSAGRHTDLCRRMGHRQAPSQGHAAKTRGRSSSRTAPVLPGSPSDCSQPFSGRHPTTDRGEGPHPQSRVRVNHSRCMQRAVGNDRDDLIPN